MQKAYKFFDSDENGKCETSKSEKKRDIVTYYDCCLTNIGCELHRFWFFWCVLINGELVGFWRIDVSELKEAMKLMGEDDPSSPFWNTASWPCKMALALLFWFISWEDLNDDEVNALFTAVDHDGNDAISFEEFCVLARFSVIFLCWISWDCEF